MGTSLILTLFLFTPLTVSVPSPLPPTPVSPTHLFNDAEEVDGRASLHVVLAVSQDEGFGHNHVEVHKLAHDSCTGGYLVEEEKRGLVVEVMAVNWKGGSVWLSCAWWWLWWWSAR